MEAADRQGQNALGQGLLREHRRSERVGHQEIYTKAGGGQPHRVG